MSEAFTFLVDCKECGKRFELNKEILKNGEYMINGRSIFITYYDCPDCGSRLFVQADDAKSKQMLGGITVQLAKIASAKKKGKTISKKQSDTFKKTRQNLSDYRMALRKELTGKSIVDEAGKTFVLRFW